MAGFFKNLYNKVANRSDVDWDELEADLISADLGVRTSLEIIETLRKLGRKISADDVVEATRNHISAVFPEDPTVLELPEDGSPLVILVVGVNGTGKTTSAAKLANLFSQQGTTVALAAADTFRAAAVEQLEQWSERLNIPLVKGAKNADPASVCYTAHQQALTNGTQVLICDTAGRLHTSHNLMEELGKIRRILGKQDQNAPHHTVLVVDATTGGNALNQAREFNKAVPLSGVIVTKLDGSGKGGVAVAIQKELNIAPQFIGTGEEPEQFEVFSREKFVEQVL
ncbi:MAG TPA: signal recognition particle-docking protein FtsY [Verrucomicrobiales bacterium]|nr:signal recognition particle-docking protein FtsY [Verrucomicrobiales bacterium]HCQ39393.1 signal recognition particle-docking protein FtsY [Verrucomicrobiales bacterium]